MSNVAWKRCAWNLRGCRSLALGAAITCLGMASTAHAQCEGAGGGAAAATGGGVFTAQGVPGATFGAQLQAQQMLQQQMALQARMEAMRAQQLLAARERQDASRERREEFARMIDTVDSTTCAPPARRPTGRAVRNTFADQAARVTERDRQVARMLGRETERRAELQARIVEREEEVQARRLRALTLR